MIYDNGAIVFNSAFIRIRFSAHDRAIVGVEHVCDPLTNEMSLITCAHDSIKIWRIGAEDGSSLSEEQKIKGWRCGVQAFDVTPDGSMAAVVGVDSTLHQIFISHDASPATIQSFNNGCMQIWHVLFAPDHMHYLTVNFSAALTLLDMNGQITKSGSFNAVRQISVIAYSPDGASIAVANNEGVVTVLSSSTLASRFFFEAHAVKVRAMCFSPDSSALLTGSDDKTIKLHQIGGSKSQLVKSFCGHRSSVTAVRFDRCIDRQRFASCSNDAMIIIWDVTSGHQLHVFGDSHDGVVNGIAFSFDSQYLVSVGDDRSICVHRVDDGKRHPRGVQNHFSNDNGPVAIQEYAGSVSAYDTDAQEAHDFYASSAQFGADAGERGAEYIPTSTQFHPGGPQSSYYHPGLRGHVGDEEEDELLARARRDLEAVSNEEAEDH
ncbi:unnamed protein product [Toxocara canis]|uniref:WD_REPEATS_REGION domain-containing protein n=1 Tax=Toxocara canis TaxID=6265 RepID=A0A183UZ63_TOXCA|nr:unnamed protein product [Toxocara canis]